MKADKSRKFMVFMVRASSMTWMGVCVCAKPHINTCQPDECQSKYGSANVWKYCCSVFDYLTLAAVSELVN
jgi:hypothetical protein